MADLTITEANIKPYDASAILKAVVLGETITKGQPLYRQADGKYYRTDADAVASSRAKGISILGGNADEIGIIQTRGPLSMGAILTQGQQYVVSANVGKIAPRSDLATADYISDLGVARTTSILDIDIDATETAVP